MVEGRGLGLKEVTNVYSSLDGERRVLNSISVVADPGEMIFVTGRNGSGKTTLLKAIAGQIDYQGSIRWQGGSEALDAESTHIDKNVTWIPQNVNSVVPDTVRVHELIGLYEADRVREMVSNEHLDWLFEKGTNKFIRRTLGNLSGGQRQLLVGALALSRDNPIILLDEVFRPLDKPTVDTYWKMLRDRIQEVRGVCIIASHDMVLATKNGDRVLVLNEGTISLDAASEDVSVEDLFYAMSM